MIKEVRQELIRLMTVILVATTVPCVFGQTGASASGDTLTVHLRTGKGKPAVQVTQVLIDGQVVPLDQPYPVRADWIDHIQIQAVNASPQAVVHSQVLLLFPETRVSGPIPATMAVGFELGRLPTYWLRQKDGTTKDYPPYFLTKAQLLVPPDAAMTFLPEPNTDPQYAAAVKKAGHAISQVDISIDVVDFANETMWRPNTGFFVPVPAPALWKPLPEADFFASKQAH